MKIKKIVGEERIIVNMEERVKIDLFPKYKNKIDQNNKLLAHLLSWLKSFNKELQDIRNSIPVERIKYTRSFLSHEYLDYITKLDTKKVEDLEQAVERLRHRLKLTYIWSFSLKIAVLTHTLLIPERESVELYIPYSSNDATAGKYPYPDYITLKKLLRQSQYPAIIIPFGTTLDDLNKWIQNNTVQINKVLSSMPSKKIVRMNEKTLLWGQIAWILKQDGIHSYTKMVKEIDKLEEKKLFVKDNEEDAKEKYQTPTADDLEKHCKRFIQYSSQLDSP